MQWIKVLRVRARQILIISPVYKVTPIWPKINSIIWSRPKI